MSSSSVSEQQIVEALQRVPPSRWGEVLDFIGSLQPLSQTETAASEPVPSVSKRWTAAELRQLPPEQRDAILAEQAALMEEEYRTNLELTAFDAFGEDDLYVDSSDTERGEKSG
jgi:hypothetical protein